MNRVKRFFRMVFRRDTWRWFSIGGGKIDYAREVGDLMSSSIVAATVKWFSKNFPEAPPALWEQIGNGQEEQAELDEPLLKLLQRPNEHYTGPLLWWATTCDWNVNGDAYWIVVPNRAGTPIQLWYTPSWLMTPKGLETDSSSFIDHYEYRTDEQIHKLDPKYVIHFRYGLDPENPRRGMSPLKATLREIYTDNEAAAFTAALLANMGVPGLIVSPEKGQVIPEEEAKETKAYLMEKLTGDHRGEPLVATGPTQVAQFGFSPEQLLLRELRRIPEERVTADIGVPAVVVGLGAGLERSTFTNMAEAREAAYESGLIPAQKILGEDVRFQLLPLFGMDPFSWRFGFDLSKVRVLQEDLYRQAQRHTLLVREGIEMVSEGRRGMGLEVDDDRDEIFLRQANVVEVPADGSAPRQLAPSSQNGNGNGAIGAGDAELVADRVVAAVERRELTEGAKA